MCTMKPRNSNENNDVLPIFTKFVGWESVLHNYLARKPLRSASNMLCLCVCVCVCVCVSVSCSVSSNMLSYILGKVDVSYVQ